MKGREPKVCASCGRVFEWRKKWERDWDNVRYCSKSCRAAKVSDIDRSIESAILDMLAARQPGATICPSEAARAVRPDGWRELMEATRRAARRLVAAGKAEITQGGGLLAIRKPWPGMLRGVHGDRDRFIETYWNKFDVDGAIASKGVSPYYFPGDGAHRDEDGYFWILGRVDDVINVSGHRLGTMEVESALVSHASVVEAAVVGMPHEIKGQGIAAFCTLAPGNEPTEHRRKSPPGHVSQAVGAIARPDQIRFTDALPKTRSGKIMRSLLRSIAAGETEVKQDTTTLEDFSVVAKLQAED